MKQKIKSLAQRRKNKKALSASDVPRITNDTVAEHREQVIKSAKKYVYPLQHSKHRIVLFSIAVLILALVIFFSYCTLALYRFQSSSTFLYRVTQVVPFPVARIGNQFVSYESYLFELRHYTHYYENQLKVDFEDENERAQLTQFKHRALDQVVNDAYVKRIAAENGITVSEEEINTEIELARQQNRLGSDQSVLEDVIQDYWGWSIDDFKRTLRQQILQRKVVRAFDSETKKQAEAALAELKSGAEFAEVAKKYSEDQITKDNGGEFGFPIEKASRELSVQSVDALFALEEGDYSEIVDTGYSLEIVKSIDINGNKVRAAHITFMYEPIENYINNLKDQTVARTYISLPPVPQPDQEAPSLEGGPQ